LTLLHFCLMRSSAAPATGGQQCQSTGPWSGCSKPSHRCVIALFCCHCACSSGRISQQHRKGNVCRANSPHVVLPQCPCLAVRSRNLGCFNCELATHNFYSTVSRYERRASRPSSWRAYKVDHLLMSAPVMQQASHNTARSLEWCLGAWAQEKALYCAMSSLTPPSVTSRSTCLAFWQLEWVSPYPIPR